MPKKIIDRHASDYFSGGGEMGELIRSMDWSKTELGPVSTWSLSLKMMVRLLLSNRFPLILFYGPKLCQIYNDAYRPILGMKHPKSMGQPASECWAEIWHIIGPLLETPYQGGPSTWMEDIFLEINRHGFIEETHFTIAYSPAPDEAAPRGIGGVLATVHEITEKVIGERRIVTLRDLSARAGDAKSVEEACIIAGETLVSHPEDIPFTLIYLIDSDRKTARLACSSFVDQGSLIPSEIELEEKTSPQLDWGLPIVVRTEELHTIENLPDYFGNSIPKGTWSDPPSKAVVAPIQSNTAHQLAGFLIAGISSRLRLDDSYRSFIQLATSQISTAIANARSYEEEKRRAEALAELDRAKTVFFSNISHEFRTPLTLMLSPIEEALSDNKLSDLNRERLEVAHRNSLRLLKLVNNLLDFSRIEAGRIQATYEPSDLSVLTTDLASVFRSMIESAGLELVIDCPPLSQPVYVDREMWEKIVLNLVSNAFKFTFEGKIEVRLRQIDGSVELSVRDTGTGIPDQELPHVFDRFRRVENARGRTYEGSGIGLALVQELVKLHGGTVSLESELNKGTVFTLSIPLGFDHLPAEQINNQPKPLSTSIRASAFIEEAMRWLPDALPAAVDSIEPVRDIIVQDHRKIRTSGKRILLADDNSDMREYVKRLLADHFEVDVAPNGEAAYQTIQRSLPDLVLTDVMMPKLDGFGLLRRLRSDERTASIPVILLSARAGEESGIEGMLAGADDYLVKPFSARELLARVEGALKLYEARIEAHRALQEREERFRELADNIDQLAWTADKLGWATWYNKRWYEYTGTSFEEMKDRGWEKVHHPDYLEVVNKKLRDSIERGAPWEDTFPIRSKNGEYRWFLSRAVPIHDEKGEILRWFGTNTDITEQRRAEELLKESREKLQAALAVSEQAGRIKDEFLATLSHELRTPLNAILGWAHILQSRSVEASTAISAVSAIYSSAKTQAQIIDDLLDIARIVSGKMNLHPEKISLADILSSATTTLGHAIRAKNISVDVRYLKGSDKIELYADAQRLQQVFWNLLSNSVKFTPQGGKIEIAVLQTSAEVIISFRDSGIGIEKDFMPFIFERFRQVDSSTSRRFGGLGLGLAITKNLVELHGGTVSAESEGTDRGTIFTVRLPLFDFKKNAPLSEQLMKIHTQDENAYNQDLSGVRVLLVDDDSNTLQLIQKAFQFSGADIRICESAACAFEVIKEWIPSLLISDIAMPDRDGYWLIREVRSLPSVAEVPAIALTAYASAADRANVLNAGFNMFVAKPVEPAELLSTAKTLLEYNSSTQPQWSKIAGVEVSRLAGKKILLIEDDLLTIQVLRMAIEQEGSEFRSAMKASQALDLLQEWIPDIIISDLGLPDEDGFALIKKIRALSLSDARSIPAIALTGYGKEEGERAIESGFQLYKSKPIEPDALIAVLKDLVTNRTIN